MAQTNLYVGGLAYEVDDTKLSELFSKAGKVNSASVIMDKYSGKSRGFAFVEMATAEGTKKAIEMFNGHEMLGRKIIVNEARPRRERPPRF